MKVTRDYSKLIRHAKDSAAIDDIRQYVGEKAWKTLLQELNNPEITIQDINIMLSFVGVQGYPFHALCRKFKLAKYRDWMNSGDNPVITDDEGFRIEETK